MTPSQHQQQAPFMAWVATGGTLAGLLSEPGKQGGGAYQPASLSPQEIMHELPEAFSNHHWQIVQPYHLGSQHVQRTHLLALHNTVLGLLNNPNCKGILITHGTDTLEDAAAMLWLTLPKVLCDQKPIVLTAAMRAWDHPESDAKHNLCSAIHCLSHAVNSVASSKQTVQSFVLQHQSNECKAVDALVSGCLPMGLVMNGLYTPLPWVRKQHTSYLNAFDVAASMPIQTCLALNVYPVEPSCFSSMQSRMAHFSQSDFLNRLVYLFWCSPCQSFPLALLANKHQLKSVLIVAAPGHGNIPEFLKMPIQALLEQGIDVIRASRCSYGSVEEGGEFFMQFSADYSGKMYSSLSLSIHQCMVLAALGGVDCLTIRA